MQNTLLERQLNGSDRFIVHVDNALRTLVSGAATTERSNPAQSAQASALQEPERRYAVGVMRMTHLATVGAQGFSQGQMLGAELPTTQRQMTQIHQDSQAHLAWCDARLKQLHSRTSCFTPACFAVSLGCGVGVAFVGDRAGLTSLALKKRLLGEQLAMQLEHLQADDQPSRSLLRQMAADNVHHAQLALESGGVSAPAPIHWGAKLISRGLFKSAYYL